MSILAGWGRRAGSLVRPFSNSKRLFLGCRLVACACGLCTRKQPPWWPGFEECVRNLSPPANRGRYRSVDTAHRLRHGAFRGAYGPVRTTSRGFARRRLLSEPPSTGSPCPRRPEGAGEEGHGVVTSDLDTTV